MILFRVFGVPVYLYGVFYVLSFLIGYFFLRFIGKSKILYTYPKIRELLTKNLEDLMMCLILGVLIGGRLGEVFIYERGYFSKHLLDIVKVWHGGMSFFGGMIGVVLSLSILFFIKNLSKKDFIVLLDCILFIVPIGILFGRLGNYFNQELYGLVVPDGFWGMSKRISDFLLKINIFHIYPKVDQYLRVNTNFISVIFEGVILFVIMFVSSVGQYKKSKISIGLNLSIFLIFYGMFRFFIEYLRVDSQSQFVGPFTKSQRIFSALFVLGIIILCYKKFKKN